VLALISLGYKQAEAHKAVQRARSEFPQSAGAGAEELIRQALRFLV